ncbi:MAG: lytic murein transglycosylase [Syntrophobacteria bacterium]|jgi:membrane-bound lytic murein transglycosylase B|nr:lytic murein transglycosylase [Deltaproteobacteria bacterium]MDH3952498.1 lytic murein transglycosylase [Deltaproteobacteria bacterium]MDH3965200.1 lytic murein transglycosylase [Deltaproteobacteria bacterium]
MADKRRTRRTGKWIDASTAAILILILLTPLTICASEPPFAKLQERLIADGLDENLVRSVYQNPLVKLELEVVAANLVRSEATLNYDQFLSKYSVHKAKRYIERHGTSLEEANRRFGVEPPVVVAVLMVETALGTYPGKYPTINVLSTMAVSQEPAVREKILAGLTEEQKQMQSRAVRSKRLTKRASRSYRELKAVLNYAHKNDIDPFTLFGSSEGAIGIPQFLPSNIEHYGRDGDGDGRIDLFNHPDAIASVAFYLRAHRWGRAENAKQKKKVLLYYNRSNYYVDTVYTLAQKLNGNKPL